MAKNDERLIFGIGFDLKSGVDEVISELQSKELPRIQKVLDKKPLKVKLAIEKNWLTQLKDFIQVTKQVASAQQQINNAKKQEIDLKIRSAKASREEANARNANIRTQINEATKQDQINKKKADAAYSEERLTQAKRNGIGATNAQNSAYNTQSSYLARLGQRMLAYASVAQAMNFLNKIREVTAEFELQRVALGAIIGDMNRANAMFQQIKEAAIKSPFQIKELLTYTKQLAAYKIETDELFETTQRLADVSAGIGVSMDRLILAYGQIRAAGYLRASEVRQLTEAGIPIVEELAKKMSQLRGETVRAAEVMGMISERAISFNMVKEVFDDMTSAGGAFYQMQEKQAETLLGQWNNLKDSISIMYEEIGNTSLVNSSMRGVIELTKTLAHNWREVSVVLITLGSSFAILKTIGYLTSHLAITSMNVAQAKRVEKAAQTELNFAQTKGNLISKLTARYNLILAQSHRRAMTATKMHERAWNSLKYTIMSNPIGFIVTVLTTLASVIMLATDGLRDFNEEIEKIGAEGAIRAEEESRNFERLANNLKNSAQGTAKHREALEELKRTYGNFLPKQNEAIEALVREKEAHDAVAQAIREKVALETLENKKSKIREKYAEKIAEAEDRAYTSVVKSGELTNKELQRALAGIRNAVEEGEFDHFRVFSEYSNKIKEIVKEQTGKSLISTGFLPYFEAIAKLRVELQRVEKSADLSVGAIGVYADEFDAMRKKIEDATGEGEKGTFLYDQSLIEEKKRIYREYVNWLLAENNKLTDNQKKTLSDNLNIFGYVQGAEPDFDAIYKALGTAYPQIRYFISKIQKEYEKLIPTDITRFANDKIQEFASQVGISMDEVKEHRKDDDKSTSDWVKGLKSSYETMEKKLAELNLLQDEFKKKGAPWKDYSSEIEKTTQEMQVLKLLMDFFKDFLDKKSAKQRAAELSILQKELQLHEKIYAKYKEYRKYMSAEEAKAKVENYFGDSIDALKFKPSFDKSGYQNVLGQYKKEANALLAKAKDETEKAAIKKFLLDIGFKINDKDWEETKENMEKKLKELSDDLSRTKTAKEFFDRMLGLTGDKQLSATLTMSVYGEGGEDLGTKLAKQTADAFKAKYKGINFSKTAISDKGVFDWDTILMEGEEESFKLGEDTYNQFLKDVDAGRKAGAKRLETLMNELEKTKTYSEKLVDIYTNTQERLNTIDQEVKDDAVRERLKKQAKELQTKEIQKLQYESFKDSPMYVAMFENLDATSTAMLTNMRDYIVKLKDAWKDGLDPTQLKELQSRINAIDKQLSSRNPFKGIIDGLKEMKSLGNRKQNEESLLTATQERLEAEKEYNKAVTSKKPNNVIADLADKLNKCVEAEDKAAKKMSEWDDATQKVMQGMQNLQQITQLVQTTTTAVNEIVEAFGGWGDSADEEFWNTILEGVNNFLGGVQSAGQGVAQIMAGDIIGGVTSLVSGIGNIVSSIVDWIYAPRIKRANKEIERQQELLDDLSYAYKRLQKASEKAFGAEFIQKYQQQLENLGSQVEAYEKQLEAERSKGKKADEDKIKDYEQQIRDTKDAIEDMQMTVSERLLGSDLASTARDFASAWIEAYKEFGNTTDAIKDKFQDMIQNMIVESLAAKVVQTLLEPIFSEVDRLAKEGGAFSIEDASVIASMADDASGDINNALSALYEGLEKAGISIRGMGGNLTGISKDIATASEESILGLATGINTQNFYISQVPAKLDTIIGLLRGENLAQGSAITLQDLVTIQNQHLSHLPSIAQHTADTVAECKQIVAETRRTADALERVIKPRGTQATHTVNIS